MLIKKKKRKFSILFWAILFAFFISCGEDDSIPPIPPDDGGGTTDDNGGGPVGFQGEVDWVRTYGGSDEDQAIAIVKTNDNAYLVLGHTKSTNGDLEGDKNTDDWDIWILKIAEDGAIIWKKVYGGPDDEIATNISKTSDGGYIVSAYSKSNNCGAGSNAGFHDYWLLKLDASGNETWCQNFGFPGSDQAFDIFETQGGGYFASGFFDVSESGGAGNDGIIGNDDPPTRGNLHGVGEYWAINMDSNGEYIWRRYFGGEMNDRSYDALQTSNGDFLLAGASESENFDITDSKGSYDYWVVRVDSQGNKLWTKSFGGSEIDVAYTLTQSNDGNYLLLGDSRSSDQDVSGHIGNADIWAVKFNDSGSIIWEKSIGGDQFESAKSIVPITDGNYLVSGSTRSATGDVSQNKGQNDAWVFIMDANANLVFEKSIGGSSFDFAEDAILAHDNSSILVVGNTESNDVDITQNKGIKDFLIFKIK